MQTSFPSQTQIKFGFSKKKIRNKMSNNSTIFFSKCILYYVIMIINHEMLKHITPPSNGEFWNGFEGGFIGFYSVLELTVVCVDYLSHFSWDRVTHWWFVPSTVPKAHKYWLFPLDLVHIYVFFSDCRISLWFYHIENCSHCLINDIRMGDF